MRVPVRLKMPRGSILRGEGEHNPFTGEVVFCAKTAADVELRLNRSISELRHIIEAIALINGKEQPLKYMDDRWMVADQVVKKKQPEKQWEVPPPAPRWEIPLHRAKSNAPAEQEKTSGKKKAKEIKFTGILKLWDS